MRYLEIVVAAAIATTVGVAPAQADRPRPSDYAPPFTPAWAAPQLEVSPGIGPPGTEVEISGAKFHRGVQAFYGDRPMPIIARDERHLVAVIPARVGGDDYIYVVDNTGRARTAYPFELAATPYYQPYERRPVSPYDRYEDYPYDRSRYDPYDRYDHTPYDPYDRYDRTPHDPYDRYDEWYDDRYNGVPPDNYDRW